MDTPSNDPGQDAPRDTPGYAVVVGIDYSELGDAALEAAFTLATSHENARIHAVYVEVDFADGLLEAMAAGSGPEPRVEAALDRLDAHCRALLAKHTPSPALPADHRPPFALGKLVSHVRMGAPALQICALAEDVDADLIVVGTHGRTGFKRLVVGSVAERVLRTARCPVLVMRPKDHGGPPARPDE